MAPVADGPKPQLLLLLLLLLSLFLRVAMAACEPSSSRNSLGRLIAHLLPLKRRRFSSAPLSFYITKLPELYDRIINLRIPKESQRIFKCLRSSVTLLRDRTEIRSSADSRMKRLEIIMKHLAAFYWR